jgi:hypothetical protein
MNQVRSASRQNDPLDVRNRERAPKALGTPTEAGTLATDETALSDALKRLLSLRPSDIVSVDRSNTGGRRGRAAR